MNSWFIEITFRFGTKNNMVISVASLSLLNLWTVREKRSLLKKITSSISVSKVLKCDVHSGRDVNDALYAYQFASNVIAYFFYRFYLKSFISISSR